MKTIKKTLKGIVTFGFLFLTAVVIMPVGGVQAQETDAKVDSVDEQRPGRRSRMNQQRPGRRQQTSQRLNQKTLDLMPDDAARFTLTNGMDMYFLDGDLYTFAEQESTFVAIPINRFSARGNTLGTAPNRRFAKNSRMNRGRWNKARKQHAQRHKQHNRRFHQG